MSSHAIWSVSLGRWRGIHVRLHGFFLVFAAFTLLLGWQAARDPETADALGLAAGSLLLLLASVVLHEWAHLAVARRFGGDADELVLGPWGGLTPLRPPLDPQAECLMHAAGPLANLTVALLGGLLLLLAGGTLTPLLHPLAPTDLLRDGPLWLQAARLVFWVNWVLFLINLLPAFPFDGGRLLRGLLAMYLRSGPPQRPALIVALVAKIAALVLLVISGLLLARPPAATQVVPVWFALILLALFLYFSAKQEEIRPEDRFAEDDLFGYDFSQGYTSLERSTDRGEPAGLVQHWLDRRRHARLLRRQQLEADEERRVDEILSRLHQEGMNSLSEEDRALLQRVSARYRQRK